MRSITTHAIDEALNERLTQEARRRKKSKSQLIKEILAREMGLPARSGRSDDCTDSYREFCGLWSDTEAAEFIRSHEGSSRIGPGDWKDISAGSQRGHNREV